MNYLKRWINLKETNGKFLSDIGVKSGIHQWLHNKYWYSGGQKEIKHCSVNLSESRQQSRPWNCHEEVGPTASPLTDKKNLR